MPGSNQQSIQRVLRSLSEPVRQLQISLFILFLLVLGGTAGYMLIEGVDWLDALYMTVITLTTVGYGEVVQLSTEGRIFTITLIMLGVGIGAWAVTNAVEVIVGQTLWTAVQSRKIRKRVERMNDHYIVCGYGRLGRRIARDLRARGEAFVVVDWSQALAQEFLEDEVPHLLADAMQDDALKAAGVERARGLVSALDSDASNVLTVLTARELNPGLLIVARANSEMSESKLRRAGADRVVTPDSIGGHRLALALLRPAVHDFFSHVFSFDGTQGADIGQILLPARSPFTGQTIAGCDLRRMRNVSILAIKLADGEFVLNPPPTRVIEAGDTLIVIGHADAVYELEALYSADMQ